MNKEKQFFAAFTAILLLLFASCNQPVSNPNTNTDTSSEDIQAALQAIVTHPQLPASFTAPASRSAFNPENELSGFKVEFNLTHLFMRLINEVCAGKTFVSGLRENFPNITLSPELFQALGGMPVKDFAITFTIKSQSELVIQSSFIWDLSPASQSDQYIVTRFIVSENGANSQYTQGWIIAYNKTADGFVEYSGAPYTYLTYTKLKQEVYWDGMYKGADTNGGIFNYIENNTQGTVLAYANETSGGIKKGSNSLYFTAGAVTAENSSIKSALDNLSNQNGGILVTRPESAALSPNNKTLLSDWLVSVYGGKLK